MGKRPKEITYLIWRVNDEEGAPKRNTNDLTKIPNIKMKMKTHVPLIKNRHPFHNHVDPRIRT